VLSLAGDVPLAQMVQDLRQSILDEVNRSSLFDFGEIVAVLVSKRSRAELESDLRNVLRAKWRQDDGTIDEARVERERKAVEDHLIASGCGIVDSEAARRELATLLAEFDYQAAIRLAEQYRQR